MRRVALSLLALTLSACVRHPAPVLRPGGVTTGEAEYLRSRHLMVPVAGIPVGRVEDTFFSARDGERVHQATDILAPRGTPVIAADDGRILKLSRNELGGNTIYMADPGQRFIFYYAHLDHYDSHIKEGMSLKKGRVLGYVGTTGNAPANTPHLHFQAMRSGDVNRWWEGTPIDIRPFLTEDGHSR